jgi:hypothetical protein
MEMIDARPAARPSTRPLSLVILAALLGLQSAVALAFGIAVSVLVTSLLADMAVGAQFMAAASVVFAIVAFFTARGAWRGRAWSFNWAAMLQIVIALAVAAALFSDGFEPQLLLALGLAGATTVALCAPSTREALSQR